MVFLHCSLLRSTSHPEWAERVALLYAGVVALVAVQDASAVKQFDCSTPLLLPSKP